MALLKALADLLFPPRCHVCRVFIAQADDLHICPSCRERIATIVEPLCSSCGTPFASAGDNHLCGTCIAHPPPYAAARAAIVYDGPGRDLVHSFKYRNQTHLRRPLALLAIQRLSPFVAGHPPHLVVPVPLHVQRLRSRGFNQAVLLGEVMAQAWGLPLERGLLKRVRPTRPQVDLTAAERRQNVKGAFAVAAAETVRDRTILLVDDVLTTGSTVEECSHALLGAGAALVVVVTVARAVAR